MIDLINLNEYCDKLEAVTSNQFFVGKDIEKFDDNGLFSERIFGVKNSKDWNEKEATIRLNTTIINPLIYRLIKRLNGKLYDVLENNTAFDLDEEGNIIKGKKYRGVRDVVKYIHNINFSGGSKTREKFIEYIKNVNNKDKILISNIIVIPPGLRPIYYAKDERDMMYDELNDMYIEVINKTRITRNIEDDLLDTSYDYLVQMVVNKLYEYIKTKISKKNGYIRGNLLAKRSDFSARSVIIGNPSLAPDEVGIPFKMAVNLFKPFILNRLKDDTSKFWQEVAKKYEMNYGLQLLELILNDISKGYNIDERAYTLIYKITQSICKKRYVLIKRDPNIHRDSIQGMKPVLCEGNAIQINPTCVGGFNADFDGDTMAVYHPLSEESQEEIKKKMVTVHSSATLDSFNKEFSKDFIIGIYTLTK